LHALPRLEMAAQAEAGKGGATMSTVTNGKVRLVWLSLSEIQPAPENELIYRPVSPDDPDIESLAKSIAEHGLREPIVITRDRYILSGHRRHEACRLAGLSKVHCRVEDVTRNDPEFETLLCEYNRQRVKTFEEVMREQVVTVNPDDAYQSLVEHRRAASEVSGEFLTIEGEKVRREISPAKRPMLDAVRKIVTDQRNHWPLTDRSIHYDMLNDPVFRHASKPDSRYKNDRSSYQDLTDLLTRARLAGLIPFHAIADETRTVETWILLKPGVGAFVENELNGFLEYYQRNLQQSQPNHIEIVGEKNTVKGSIHSIAEEFCIPYTLGRGYCSLDPRKQMFDRFKKSGKDKLIILVMSDFDPEGDDIPNSFGKSMRDDFGIPEKRLLIKQVCLTYKQVMERNLPRTFDMKTEGKRYNGFVRKYPDHPYGHELESIPVAERQKMLTRAINEVLDVDAYNREVDAEKKDAANLLKLRKVMQPLLMDALRTMEDGGGQAS
jgi:hypothetical protein